MVKRLKSWLLTKNIIQLGSINLRELFSNNEVNVDDWDSVLNFMLENNFQIVISDSNVQYEIVELMVQLPDNSTIWENLVKGRRLLENLLL